MILIAQGTILSGFWTLLNNRIFKTVPNLAILLTYGVVTFFFGILIVGEIIHRKTLNKIVPFKEVEEMIDEEEFRKQISEGKDLVLLDNMVLDVSKFIFHHPGGKFLLKHNVGRDISKFFYGAYALEGHANGQPQKGHLHSSYARKIVNTLILAKFDSKIVPTTTYCKLRTDLTIKVNATTSTFYFESINREPVTNFKTLYPGLNMITKHFTVRCL